MSLNINDTYKEMKDVPVIMTVEELGKLLRISRTSAYEMVRSGQIPSFKVGKQSRIYRGDVLALRKKMIPTIDPRDKSWKVNRHDA